MDGKIIQALALLFFLGSCKPKEGTQPVINAAGDKVYVTCEGRYQNGNSMLSLYFPQTGNVYSDVYQSANGKGIGDVLQSMVRIGDRLFLCVNNSDKIVVINAGDWKLQGTIPIHQPRYILPVSATRAYVSTLKNGKVYIINTQTLQVTGSISMPFSDQEGLLLAGGGALICNWDSAAHSLSAVDTATDNIGNPILLPHASPTDIATDAEGKIWVVGGNIFQGLAPSLSRIDPLTGAVLADFNLPSSADAMRLSFNAAKDTLYWLETNYNGSASNNGVYRTSIHAGILPSTAFIPAVSNQYFWALGIEPSTGNIYVGDPKGFIQSGAVNIYRPDGVLIKTFGVGVGPNHFYFEQ